MHSFSGHRSWRSLAGCLLAAAFYSHDYSQAKVVKLDTSFGQLANSGGAIVYSDFALDIYGWKDSSEAIDSDLRAKGITSVLTNVDPLIPTSSAYGLGRIRVTDGLMRAITFQYGVRGDQHQDPITGIVRGGFTGFVRSEYFGHATPSGVYGAITNQDGVFKQFALNQGQPTGPVTLRPTFTDTTTGCTGTTFNEFYWTTGSAFADPTTPTRAGKSEIGDIVIDVIPAKDILRDSITVVPGASYEMKLAFQPHLPDGSSVRLEDLAAALEVDHFNWVQRVTHVPGGWQTLRATTPDGTTVNSSVSQNTGFIDPIPQTAGFESVYIYTKSGNQIGDWVQDWVDDQLPYYNESIAPFYRGATHITPASWSIESKTFYDTSTLTFLDVPQNSGLDPNKSDEYFGFETELVGVRSDGTLRYLNQDFPNLGLLIKWKSNTTTIGGDGEVTLQLAGDSITGMQVGGGIFDVESNLMVTAPNGDYNGDNLVDHLDYVAWKDSYGEIVPAFAGADGNGDGIVNAGDFVVWRNRYSETAQQIAYGYPVPEPGFGIATITAFIFFAATSHWIRKSEKPGHGRISAL